MTSRLSGWRRVLEAVEALLTRVACLESAIEGATGEGEIDCPRLVVALCGSSNKLFMFN